MTNHVIKIEPQKCVGCGLCIKTCVAHNIKLKNGKAETLLDNCLMCGQCSAVYPKEAVTINGYDSKPIPQKEKIHLNSDDVLEVIRFRRTIRQFQKKEIPKHVLEQILEAERLTHMAKNMQDVSFVVLDKKRSYRTNSSPLIQKNKTFCRFI